MKSNGDLVIRNIPINSDLSVRCMKEFIAENGDVFLWKTHTHPPQAVPLPSLREGIRHP